MQWLPATLSHRTVSSKRRGKGTTPIKERIDCDGGSSGRRRPTGAGAGEEGGVEKEEDKLLRELVKKHGAKDWGVIAGAFPGRTDKSCLLRWRQHLDPSVDAAQPFTPDEDRKIVELQRVHSNRWATIAAFLPGRSDNAIKNRWNNHLHKQQQQQQTLERTPVCLPLFPLTPGFHHNRVRPLPIGENAPGPARSALPECLKLFPLPPGDIRDNASAAAAMDVDSEAICSLTELRLARAAVVFDAMPLQALRM